PRWRGLLGDPNGFVVQGHLLAATQPSEEARQGLGRQDPPLGHDQELVDLHVGFAWRKAALRARAPTGQAPLHRRRYPRIVDEAPAQSEPVAPTPKLVAKRGSARRSRDRL